jgi:hypothetical protein
VSPDHQIYVIMAIETGSGIALTLFSHRALLVQLVERWSPKPNVGGSSPPGRVLITPSQDSI